MKTKDAPHRPVWRDAALYDRNLPQSQIILVCRLCNFLEDEATEDAGRTLLRLALGDGADWICSGLRNGGNWRDRLEKLERDGWLTMRYGVLYATIPVRD